MGAQVSARFRKGDLSFSLFRFSLQQRTNLNSCHDTNREFCISVALSITDLFLAKHASQGHITIRELTRLQEQ